MAAESSPAPRELAGDYVVEDFAAFYEREFPAVVALMYARTRSRWVAEDLAQDAFVVVHREWERVGRYERPGAFLRRVALNLASSRGRRLLAEARAVGRLALLRPPQLERLPSEDSDFWGAVRALPRRQADALVLHLVADLPAAEIAQILGCAEATVRVHLHRGRKTVASQLGLGED